jgi:hypothetical protein
MNSGDREEMVVVHGIESGGGAMVNIWLKASGMGLFVEKCRAYRDDITQAAAYIRNTVSGCIKLEKDGWNKDCEGGHPVWSTLVMLRRGALKEPTKSGPNAGQRRDPSIDHNYKWEVSAFLDGPSPKKISANGKNVVEAKLDHASVLMFQRECNSNDRTALMQAVAFGATDSSNILSDQEVMRLTALWGDLLNERALSRLNPGNQAKPPVGENKGSTPPGNAVDALDSALAQSAVDAGAVVTNIQSSVRNIEDVKKILDDKGVSTSQISRVLKEGGYERGGEWLKKNGLDNFAGLLSFIEKGLSESW